MMVKIVNDIDLLNIQDSDGITRSDILYYYIEMYACLSTNLNTQLCIVNKA